MKRFVITSLVLAFLGSFAITEGYAETGDAATHRNMYPQTSDTYDLGSEPLNWRTGRIVNVASSLFNFATETSFSYDGCYRVTLSYSFDNVTNQIVSGTPLIVKASSANLAGGTYLSVNGGARYEIMKRNNTTLTADHIEAEQMFIVIWDGGQSKWQIINEDSNP